jgi:hypothetical protein
MGTPPDRAPSGQGRDRPRPVPAIYQRLKRHGLIELRRRRKRQEDYLRWERERPLQLWQIDAMGG